MGKFKDLNGEKIDRLTVLEYVGRDKHKKSLWKCKCDCGKTIVVTLKRLTSKTQSSCGCLHKENTIKRCRRDLKGQKFNKLTVIRYSHTKGKEAFWDCLCECGNTKKIRSHHLTGNRVKSCGCLRIDDIINQKFGKLTVIKYLYTKDGQSYWECLCDCGNKKNVSTNSLRRKNTKSCGCLVSCGNNKIVKILNDLKKVFKKEKTFKGCRDKGALRFDFYLPDYNLCIEFQGRQHYTYYESWKIKNGGLEGIQRRDQIKRDYCLQNNIDLLEISYKDFNNIEEILKERLLKKEEIKSDF